MFITKNYGKDTLNNSLNNKYYMELIFLPSGDFIPLLIDSKRLSLPL
jgi:hypothetical protein